MAALSRSAISPSWRIASALRWAVTSQVTPMRRSSRPSASSTGIERLDSQCTSPLGQTTRNSWSTGWAVWICSYSLPLMWARSSGCTQARRSAAFIAPARGVWPRRRHICSSQSVWLVTRSSSQVARPTARVASAARSDALRKAFSALCRSVMSMTTPYSSVSSVPAPTSRREWLTSCRSLPSARTMRKASSFDSRPLRIQAKKASFIAWRSAGCTYCATHSDTCGAGPVGGSPNTANSVSLHCGCPWRPCTLQWPMPAVRVTSSKRRISPAARRVCSTRSVTSIATPMKATASPARSRSTTRRVSTSRQVLSLRR